MTKAILLYIPIDINVKNANYNIPTIENQKDTLAAGFLTPASVPPPTTTAVTPGRRRNFDDEEEKVITALHQGWMSIMSFSHNVASEQRNFSHEEEESSHVGSLTCTKFVSADSPSLNYLCLRREILPHAILRSVGEVKNNKVNIIEYQLEYAQLTNVSISGGAGGHPVETLSIDAKIIKTKYIDLDIQSSEFDTYQVYQWDMITKTGLKTVRSANKVSSEMISYGSSDPSMIALIKELGLATSYDLPEAKQPSSYKVKVLANATPTVYKVVQVSTLDKKSLIAAIAEKFNIPSNEITSIYSQGDQCEIEDNQSFIGSIPPTHIFFRTSDGKFYGH